MINYETRQALITKIKEELKPLIKTDPNIFADNIIDLFLKVLLYELNDASADLDGLQHRVPNALVKLLLEDIPKDEMLKNLADFVKIEPFLQKILYLTDHTQYEKFSNQKKGLAAYIDFLRLNPNNLDLSIVEIKDARGKSAFAEHLIRVYQLRNAESHTCVQWSKKEIFENVESVLIIYIYSIYRNLSSLRPVLNKEPNLNLYLNSVVKEFELWQKRFVHITGIENFEGIDLYAIESEESLDSGQAMRREGRIDDLRKTINENSMVVLGEPGMGKSTTLQYLSYNDAKSLLSNNSQKVKTRIPIYLELKLFSINDSILDIAQKKIGIEKSLLIDYFHKGSITLFLDGLNEILPDLRKPLRVEIQNIITTYSNLLVIITARPMAYYNEFKGTPVFVLQRMENSQVEEFLEKNCPNVAVRNKILSEVKNNIRLGKIVRVPLLLKMLINVVLTNKGTLPENKVQVIKSFIQNLYDREKKKFSFDIDFRIIHRLLCFVGYNTRDSNGSNVGWKVEDLEAVIEKRIENSRFNISTFEFLDFAVDLNILVKDGNKYSFIHELYQEYYASEEIYRLNAKEKR